MEGREVFLINGEVVSLSEKHLGARSILLKGENIAAVDPPLPVEIPSGASREVIDLKGKAVIPGMTDSHVHFTHVGLGLIFPDFREASSVSDVLDGVSTALKGHPRNEFLLGWNFDENRFREKRAPTLEELNRVSAEVPIWVNRIGMNASIFNRRAWERLNLPPGLPGVSPEPRGEVSGDANWIALARVLNLLADEVKLKAYQEAAAHCASKGVTSIHAMEGCFSPNMPDLPDFACREVQCLAENRDRIDLDVAVWYQHIVHYEKDVALTKRLGLSRIGGDAFVDGVLGAAMSPGVMRAALFEPYFDDPSTRGDLLFRDEEIERFVSLSRQAGLQFSAHAVGDRAIAQLLTAYDKALRKKPGDARFRVEHATLPGAAWLPKAAELGVIFSMQPAFDHYSGGPEGRYGRRVGPQRARFTNPFRDIFKAGIRIAGGSDSPVNPIDPLFGIHCMVNHHYPDQRVSSLEALKSFTCHPAFSVFEDGHKGRIEEGMQADLAVLSANPIRTDPEKIKDIEVLMTIRRGKVHFRSPVF